MSHPAGHAAPPRDRLTSPAPDPKAWAATRGSVIGRAGLTGLLLVILSGMAEARHPLLPSGGLARACILRNHPLPGLVPIVEGDPFFGSVIGRRDKRPGRFIYVSPDGSDQALGSAEAPLRSIQQALDSGPGPGDQIIVRPGSYSEALTIHRGGSPEGQVTLRAETPGSVILKAPADRWNAITITDDYVTVQGFEIVDAVGDGIEANHVHHVAVLDNVIHGSGESGIQMNWSEFILIAGNTTYENASSGWFSGISVYENRNITGDTTTPGFRTILRNNISYRNLTLAGEHSDGNGIIIDDFQSTQDDAFPNYIFPTLVENNLVYLNGGKGIQITWSDHVTVRNNTAWHNNQDEENGGSWRGEISNSVSSDNSFANNIAVADPKVTRDNTAYDNTSTEGDSNRNIRWLNNLSYAEGRLRASLRIDAGNDPLRAEDGNILGENPRFRDPPRDFRLAEDSPAIDAGTAELGLSARDLDGAPRLVGRVDLGAYESAQTGKGAPP